MVIGTADTSLGVAPAVSAPVRVLSKGAGAAPAATTTYGEVADALHPVLVDATSGQPRELSADAKAMYGSVSSVKRELKARELETETPGLKGDERAAELGRRLLKQLDAEDADARQAELAAAAMARAEVRALRGAAVKDANNLVLLRELDAALARRQEGLIQWLQTHGARAALADVAYTLQIGRVHLDHRCAVVARDADDLQWSDYVFLRNNVSGMQTEWWYHRTGCRLWFLAERHTKTNEITSTYLWKPESVE